MKKSQILRANMEDSTKITLDGKELDDKNEFTYLGAKLTKTRGTEEDVSS